MTRFLIYAGTALVLVIFVLTMTSGRVLKKPLSGNDDIQAYLAGCQQAVINKDWDQAGLEADRLSLAWNKVKPRLYLSAEKDDLTRFDRTLVTLRASVVAQDRISALRDIATLRHVFRTLE